MNEQRTDDGKFEGYIHNGMGSRSAPIDRMAGWQTKT